MPQQRVAIGTIQFINARRWEVRVYGQPAAFRRTEREARDYFNRQPRAQVHPATRVAQASAAGRISFELTTQLLTTVYLIYASPTVYTPTVRFMAELHYEGSDSLLDPEKAALEAFRALHPEVRVTQCFNAQEYYLGADAATVTARYMALLNPNGEDEVACHFHPQGVWVTSQGVTLLLLETYASAVVPSVLSGYDVILTSYSDVDFATLLNYQLNQFQTQGFPRPTTYVAGGFLLNAQKRAVEVTCGITRDLGQVPSVLTAPVYGANLQTKSAIEYAGVTTTTQPTSSGGLIRVPTNAAMISYNPEATTLAAFDANADLALADPSYQPLHASGMHFSVSEINAMSAYVTAMKARAIVKGVALSFVRANEINA